MNDRNEIQSGRKALADAIDARPTPLEKWQLDQLKGMGVLSSPNQLQTFLLCASEDGDSLTLWRSYGAGGDAEYAVELDPGKSLYPVIQNDADAHPYPPPGWEVELEYGPDGEQFVGYDPDEAYAYGGQWGLVKYLTPTSSTAGDELEDLVIQLRKPAAPDKRMIPLIFDYLAGPEPTALWKDPGFKDEREVRMMWHVNPWWKVVKYRPGRFGVTPFIEVAASREPREYRGLVEPAAVTRLPIKTVRIGPTRNEKSAIQALRQMLDAHGYGGVEIETSETPYR
ncbi:hypothetical protein [Agromyces sp. NPDC058126]|uniref:hypothetical protein n=1 Tax=Agromyces sp. NPDC058126 TaxID=3346350 RepID=UPI0036D7AD95